MAGAPGMSPIHQMREGGSEPEPLIYGNPSTTSGVQGHVDRHGGFTPTGVQGVNHKVTIIHGRPHTPEQAWDHDAERFTADMNLTEWPDWLVITVASTAICLALGGAGTLLVLGYQAMRRWLG